MADRGLDLGNVPDLLGYNLRRAQVALWRDFLRELEVSLATFKRDIEYMRSRHYAPIVWDRDQNGYRFEAPAKLAAAGLMPWSTAGWMEVAMSMTSCG